MAIALGKYGSETYLVGVIIPYYRIIATLFSFIVPVHDVFVFSASAVPAVAVSSE